jgi:hypothetical protein
MNAPRFIELTYKGGSSVLLNVGLIVQVNPHGNQGECVIVTVAHTEDGACIVVAHSYAQVRAMLTDAQP